MAKLHSEKIEKGVISLLLQPPLHIKSLSINLDLFSIDKHKTLVRLIKKFVYKNKSAVPNKDDLIMFTNTLANTENKITKYTEALGVLDSLPEIDKSQTSYYFDQANNYYIGRKIYDLNEYIAEEYSNPHVDFSKIKQNLMKELFSIGSSDGGIRRGYMYDKIKDRWEAYKQMSNGTSTEFIPFGIESLDKNTGGMKKTSVTLVFSKTGGGKSRFVINTAHNVALAGYSVMYISLEMDFDILSSIFDARTAFVNSKDIMLGTLSRDDKKKYLEALKKQHQEKPDIWISDIPQGANMEKVYSEMENYKMINGIYPDLVIIDYANLLEPTDRQGDRSVKLGNLFKELHEFSRLYRTAVLTMTQESRIAAMRDIEKKNKKGIVQDVSVDDDDGVHDIAASSFIAHHCEYIIKIKQTQVDRTRNRLWALLNKNRLGQANIKLSLFVAWEYSYIGDKRLPNVGLKFNGDMDENI